MEFPQKKGLHPVHPGEILREDILPAIQMSKTELAKKLGISKQIVSEIISEHRSITPDTAIRLSKLIGSTPEFWLRLQQAFDIWSVEHNKSTKYSQIKRLKKPQVRAAM